MKPSPPSALNGNDPYLVLLRRELTELRRDYAAPNVNEIKLSPRLNV
jgi:hypothetical protein